MESAQEINIREMCALCQSMPCCPEHCCDWDSCKCSHCQSRLTNPHLQTGIGFTQQNVDPTILIMSTGTEEVKKVKKLKAKKNGEPVQIPELDKELHMPSEQLRANDGALIINYEVPIEEEEDKVVYSGGVKGIRALRQQRDQINSQIEEDLMETRNKFNKYEQKQEQQQVMKATNQNEEESKR